MLQYQFCHHGCLECLKGHLLFVTPFPVYFFPCQVGERCCDLAIILYKPSVEVGESYKALDSLDARQFFPFLDYPDFLFIHTQALWEYYVSQVFDFCGVEFALGSFQC